jgi:leucyl-tRNA synthetase
MKPNTGKYAGLNVAEAKDKVKGDLIEEHKAETMYELMNKPVLCRCGTECVVKMFEDQWFIDYRKPEWKKLAHEWLDQMQIFPEELRAEFNYNLHMNGLIKCKSIQKNCVRSSIMSLIGYTGKHVPEGPDWAPGCLGTLSG